jgi:hypothetical protein
MPTDRTLSIGSAGAHDLFAGLFPPGCRGFVETRCIKDGKAFARDFHPISRAGRAYSANRGRAETADVYLGVAPRVRKEGTKDAVEEVYAVWVDLDRPDAALALAEFAPQPSLVLASGTEGHLHAYWYLEGAAGPAEVERVNRALARRLGGDLAATDASRMMRLPGTYNHKTPALNMARVVYTADERFSLLSDFGSFLKGDTVAPAVTTPGPEPSAEPNEAVGEVLGKLSHVRATGKGWTALCPAHDDHKPSLSIAQGEDGRCLLHCFAGCEPQDVVDAIGLTLRDLAAADDPHAGKSLADQLVSIAHEAGIELFHDDRHQPFAAVPVSTHLEVWKLGSPQFQDWLRKELYTRNRRAANTNALTDALGLLGAEARFAGECRTTHVRVAGDHTRVLIDLADHEWRVVEITPEGWTVLDGAPVAFLRRGATLPLAEPATDGDISVLREFVNVGNDADWLLLIAYMVMALTPKGPFPILILHGESGAAKSTTARIIRQLIDPAKAPLRAGAPGVRDLMIAAEGSWLVAFDNLRYVKDELSDVLCQLATGAGFATRELWTNDEEIVFEAMRPAILNGIGGLAKRPDLVSRAVALELPALDPADTMTESELWERFELERAQIQGALFDLVSSVLATIPSVNLDHAPRMADFARVGTALEQVLGLHQGAFIAALDGQRQDALQASLDADPLGPRVVVFMSERTEWAGTATELLKLLTDCLPNDSRPRTWPSTPAAMSKRLVELAPALRSRGLGLGWSHEGRDNYKTRQIVIRWVGDDGDDGDDGDGGDA